MSDEQQTDPQPEPDEQPDQQQEQQSAGDDPVAKAVAEATRKANAEAAKFRKQRDENAKRLKELEAANKGKVDESEVEKAAREAAEKATSEWTAKMARKEAEAQLYRDHGRKFQRPDDALAFINLDELDEDTTLDAAVEQLLTERPYLAVDETRPSGSRDAGSRTPPKDRDPGEMSVPEYQEWRNRKIAAGEWAGA